MPLAVSTSVPCTRDGITLPVTQFPQMIELSSRYHAAVKYCVCHHDIFSTAAQSELIGDEK